MSAMGNAAADAAGPRFGELAGPDVDHYKDVAELVHDVKSLIGEKHPYTWLREEVPPGGVHDYFRTMKYVLGHICGDDGGAIWDSTLPADIFTEGDDHTFEEVDAFVPLGIVNFRETTKLDDNQVIQTCWRDHSKIRIMMVVEKLFTDKKGLRTQERPLLVAQRSMQGKMIGELEFACAHGIGSTRLMAGQVHSSS